LFHCQQCENKQVPERTYTQKDVNNLTDYWCSKVVQAKAEGRKTAVEELEKLIVKKPDAETRCECESKRDIRKHRKHRVNSINDFVNKECEFGNLCYIQYSEFYTAYVQSCLHKKIDPESPRRFSVYLKKNFKKVKLIATSVSNEGLETPVISFFTGITTLDKSFCKTPYKSMDARKILSEFLEECQGSSVKLDDVYLKYCVRINDSFGYAPMIKGNLSALINKNYDSCSLYRETNEENRSRMLRNVAFKKFPAIPNV